MTPLRSPLQAQVVECTVAVGDAVRAGDVLLILEAMKMEHLITCTGDGIVKEVRVTVGAQVEAGQVLLVVDTGESEG